MTPLRDMTEPQLRRFMHNLARRTVEMLPPGTLFVTLAFEESQFAQYVSNAEREGIIEALRETADRLERREDIPR